MAEESGDDPFIMFEEEQAPADSCESGGFDDLPFV